MARPPKYAIETAKPVSVSLRIPRDLHEQAQREAEMCRTTLTELLLDGLRMRLQAQAAPRGVPVLHGDTVMQQVEQMIDTRVHAILASHGIGVSGPAPIQDAYDSNTEHYRNTGYDSNTESYGNTKNY